MSLAVVFFLVFNTLIGINHGMVYVNKLPIKMSTEVYTEEVWIYLTKPISKATQDPATNPQAGTDLYLFYEKDVSKLQLSSQSSDPTKIESELTINLLSCSDSALSSETSVSKSKCKPSIGYWIHFAISIGSSGSISYFIFYVNGVPSDEPTGSVAFNALCKVWVYLIYRI